MKSFYANKLKSLIDDEESEEDAQENCSFLQMATEFEKTHALILGLPGYVRDNGKEIQILTAAALTNAYQFMGYKAKNGKMAGFINKWMKCNNDILRYDNIGCFPPPLICPHTDYNTWKPFYAQTLKGPYEKNQRVLSLFRGHLKKLCNDDLEVFSFVERWIAQMLQYPAIKTWCLVLISKQGSGKGLFNQMMKRMVGDSKYLETANMNQVFGNFNKLTQNAFFININEASQKDTTRYESQIKTAITDSEATITPKGIDTFKSHNFSRYLITSNKGTPVVKEADDRRFLVVRASDYFKGKTVYFTEMYDYLKDDSIVRTLYDFYSSTKKFPNMKKFNELKIISTQYSLLTTLSVRKPLSKFLEYFADDKLQQQKNIEDVSITTLYELWKDWLEINVTDIITLNETKKLIKNVDGLILEINHENADGYEGEKQKAKKKEQRKVRFDYIKIKNHYDKLFPSIIDMDSKNTQLEKDDFIIPDDELSDDEDLYISPKRTFHSMSSSKKSQSTSSTLSKNSQLTSSTLSKNSLLTPSTPLNFNDENDLCFRMNKNALTPTVKFTGMGFVEINNTFTTETIEDFKKETIEDFKTDTIEDLKKDTIEDFKTDIIEELKTYIIEDLKKETIEDFKKETFEDLKKETINNYETNVEDEEAILNEQASLKIKTEKELFPDNHLYEEYSKPYLKKDIGPSINISGNNLKQLTLNNTLFTPGISLNDKLKNSEEEEHIKRYKQIGKDFQKKQEEIQQKRKEDFLEEKRLKNLHYENSLAPSCDFINFDYINVNNDVIVPTQPSPIKKLTLLKKFSKELLKDLSTNQEEILSTNIDDEDI